MKKHTLSKIIFPAMMLLFFSTQVFSIDLQIKGFGTAGSIITDSNVGYNFSVKKKPSFFYDSKVGLNFTARLSSKVSAAIQLLAKDWKSALDYENPNWGGLKDFAVKADWAFTTYSPFPGLDLRIGKQKLPVWLISDRVDIGFLYPWIRPPYEVYSINIFTTFFGGNVGYRYNFGDYSLLTEASYGQGFDQVPIGSQQYLNVNSENLWSFNASISHSYFTFRSAYTQVPVNSYIFQSATGTPAGKTSYKFTTIGGSGEYADFFLMSEYAFADITGNMQYHGIYFTLGYTWRFLTPHFTFGYNKFHSGINVLTQFPMGATMATMYLPEINMKQNSMIFGFNLKTSEFSNFKIEYQRTSVKDIPWTKMDLSVSGQVVSSQNISESSAGPFTENPGRAVNIFSIAFNFIF